MPYRERQISSRLSKIKRSLAALNGHKLLVVVMVALLVPMILPRPTHADGCLFDLTFDQDGKVDTDFIEGYGGAQDIALQPDGKIIAVGSVHRWAGFVKSGLARYHPDGSLDRSFGKGGRVVTGGSSANAVALQADGKIVTVGQVNFKERPYDSSFYYGFGAVRHNHDGSLDTSFGQGGRVGIDDFAGGTIVRSYDRASDVAIQPDGKIVIVGQTNKNTDYEDVHLALARLNSDGSLDTSFGGDGKVATLFGSKESRTYATSVALQPDGKIVVGGYYRSAGGRNFALARYHTDGRLDKTFGGDGRVVTVLSSITPDSFEYSSVFVAIQPDGKILAAGTMEVPQYPDYTQGNDAFALARYNANGRLDETFGTEGKVSTDFSQFSDMVYDIALQPNGKIVLAGRAGRDFGEADFGLARYLPDGSPDNTFDTDGKLTSRFSCASSTATAVASQADGKIIVAGGGSADFMLVRYPAEPSSNGTPRLVSLIIGRRIVPGIPNYEITSGLVSLCGAAPAGGLEVILTNTNEAASVPASVTVPAGETTACFNIITTKYVGENQGGLITAYLGGASRRAWLVVRPIGIREFGIDRTSDPDVKRGYLYLEGNAPPGGITVTLSSSHPKLASPVKQVIKFPHGTNFQTFDIRIHKVLPNAQWAVYIKATTDGNSKTAFVPTF